MESSRRGLDGRSAFTLIELMIAVLIVGILSSLAIPKLINYQLRSKTAEVDTNLGAIQVAEEAYFSEFGRYLSAAPEPDVIPGSQATAFDSPGSDFSQLSFAPEGRVYFSYGVTAAADQTGYTADAGADIDANGIVQLWGFAKPDAAGNVSAGQVGCAAAALVPLSMGPCTAGSGRSIF